MSSARASIRSSSCVTKIWIRCVSMCSSGPCPGRPGLRSAQSLAEPHSVGRRAIGEVTLDCAALPNRLRRHPLCVLVLPHRNRRQALLPRPQRRRPHIKLSPLSWCLQRPPRRRSPTQQRNLAPPSPFLRHRVHCPNRAVASLRLQNSKGGSRLERHASRCQPATRANHRGLLPSAGPNGLTPLPYFAGTAYRTGLKTSRRIAAITMQMKTMVAA